MAYRVNFYESNKADFTVDFSATDADTGDDINFTGAEVSIKVTDDSRCTLVDASITNGLITQPSTTVLELTVPEATMKNICAGTYHIGCVFSLDAGVSITQLFEGNLVVYEGVAAL